LELQHRLQQQHHDSLASTPRHSARNSQRLSATVLATATASEMANDWQLEREVCTSHIVYIFILCIYLLYSFKLPLK
jgi:uncharacterized membrane protein YbaN (DUF454 family)